MSDPNPYLLAMSVVIEVQALLALERLDEAERAGRRTVERVGDRVPQARSMILGTVAAALHEAGRADEAYRALSQSVEIERRAFASRPTATGSPACTTAATSRAKSTATS